MLAVRPVEARQTRRPATVHVTQPPPLVPLIRIGKRRQKTTGSPGEAHEGKKTGAPAKQRRRPEAGAGESIRATADAAKSGLPR